MGIIRIEMVNKVVEANEIIRETASQKTKVYGQSYYLRRGQRKKNLPKNMHKEPTGSQRSKRPPRPREDGAVDDRGQLC